MGQQSCPLARVSLKEDINGAADLSSGWNNSTGRQDRTVLWLGCHYKRTVLVQKSSPLARVSLVLPRFLHLLVHQNSEQGIVFLIFAKHAMDYCLCVFITKALLATVSYYQWIKLFCLSSKSIFSWYQILSYNMANVLLNINVDGHPIWGDLFFI